jgi:hypothetical protein
MYDAMDRGLVNFVLAGKTALSAKLNEKLEGDGITLAVRRLELESGERRILDSVIQPVSEDEDKLVYVYKDIPIQVYILNDHSCITSPDQIMYEHEFFKIPNTIEDFEKEYAWVK